VAKFKVLSQHVLGAAEENEKSEYSWSFFTCVVIKDKSRLVLTKDVNVSDQSTSIMGRKTETVLTLVKGRCGSK
jgi:hypothetical protein